MSITTPEQFKALVERIESHADYRRPAAFAIGIASFAITQPGRWGVIASGARILDTYYPLVDRGEDHQAAAILASLTGYRAGTANAYLDGEQVDQALAMFQPLIAAGRISPTMKVLQGMKEFLAVGGKRGAEAPLIPRQVVVTFIGDLADKPIDTHDTYLRLHLLSLRKVAPHGLNLSGIFGLLSNVVWTGEGPFDPETFEDVRLHLRTRGREVRVHSIDKFPRMTDYVMPTGVRIADADRVRLGAHLAPGTTVMHEGFVNFNAGTLGTSMVEGRISAGVVVGNGSDIGGGASIMGTLSGGGAVVIRVGERCLLGANSGLGISLGDNCTIEAGLYLTAGSKVRLHDASICKAGELSGKSDMLYRRHSQTGAIEAISKRAGGWAGLNAELHSN